MDSGTFTTNTSCQQIKGKFLPILCIKDPWTKPKRVGLREVGMDGAGESGGGKMETIVLEQQ